MQDAKIPCSQDALPSVHKDTVTDNIPVSHAQTNQTKMVFCTNKSRIKLNICFVRSIRKKGFSCNSSILTGAISAYI